MTITRQAMETRRLEAAVLLNKGMRPAKVARLFDVSRATACRWAVAVKTGASLARSKPPGRPARAHRTLLGMLVREREHWTGREFARRIEERLGVFYDQNHAGRIGKRLAPERFGRLMTARQLVNRLIEHADKREKSGTQ